MSQPVEDCSPGENTPEPGRVSEVCRAWMLRTDEELAHKLQDDEIAHHLNGNKNRNEQIREDFPAAAAVQAYDERRMRQEVYRRRQLMEEDAKIAEELQKKIIIGKTLPKEYQSSKIKNYTESYLPQRVVFPEEAARLHSQDLQDRKKYTKNSLTNMPALTIHEVSEEDLNIAPIESSNTKNVLKKQQNIPVEEISGENSFVYEVPNLPGMSSIDNGNENYEIPCAAALSEQQDKKESIKKDINKAGTSYESEDLSSGEKDIKEIEMALGVSSQKIYQEKERLLQEEKDAEIARSLMDSEIILEIRDGELARILQDRENERFQKSKQRQKFRHRQRELEQRNNTNRNDVRLTDTYCQPRDILPASNILNEYGDGDGDGDSHYMEVFPTKDIFPHYTNNLSSDQNANRKHHRAPPDAPKYMGRPKMAEPTPTELADNRASASTFPITNNAFDMKDQAAGTDRKSKTDKKSKRKSHHDGRKHKKSSKCTIQ